MLTEKSAVTSFKSTAKNPFYTRAESSTLGAMLLHRP